MADRASPGREAPDTALESLKFRFGFVLHRAEEPGRHAVERALPKAGWREQAFGAFRLWTHPETRIATFEAPGRALIALGEVYAFATGAPPDLACLGNAPDETAFLDTLDGLGGRFALVLIEGERARVFHDAIGSRSVFYHAGPPFGVASHAVLLARAVRAPDRPDVAAFLEDPGYRTRTLKYLPGDLTLHEGIYGLIPNHFFDSATLATPRYWPRAPLAPMEFEGFARVVEGYFDALTTFVGTRFSPVFGLTGGADSRMIFAAFHAKGIPFETVTWRGGYLDPAELPTIERIAAHLALPHRFLDRPGGKPTIARIAGRNTGDYRGPCRLAHLMHSAYPIESGRVFVRGHGAEIMRGFYNSRGAPLRGFGPAEMIRAYFRDSGTKNLTDAARAFVCGAFEEFHARGDYARLDGLGYDPNDIFYWEHRMGMWGSVTNCELDVAMPVLIGLNGRPLYAATFGLPRERRLTKRLFLELTERYDPVLARIPLAPPSGQNAVSLDAPPKLKRKSMPKPKPRPRPRLARRVMNRLRRILGL